jgi:hypothetical protein
MRRAATYMMTLGLVLAAGAALAQGTAELTPMTIDSANHPLATGARFMVGETDRPEALKGVPDALSEKAYYFQLQIGRAPLLAVFDPSGDKGALYIDTDGDADLSDEKRIEVAIARGRTDYVVAAVHPAGLPEGTTVNVGLLALTDGSKYCYLSTMPASDVRGTVELDGRKYKVAIIDADCDGRYDGFMTVEKAADPAGSDLIAFGAPEGEPPTDQGQGTEVAPLSRVVHIGEAYYNVEPAADGSRIELTTAALEFGLLDVECPALCISLLSTTGLHTLKGGGPWTLPVGTYTLRDFHLEAADEAGAVWSLSGASWMAGRLAQFEIRASETTTIPAGPPLVLDTGVTWQGDTASIDFTITGRAGERYAGPATKDGQPRPAPKVTVVDRGGAELASGTFAYG